MVVGNGMLLYVWLFWGFISLESFLEMISLTRVPYPLKRLNFQHFYPPPLENPNPLSLS